MKFTLKNEDVAQYNNAESYSFPKYTSQLINWANQNAHGTRPVVVGQLSELFPEFMKSGNDATIEEWRKWYIKKYPDALDKASNKIYNQMKNLQSAIQLIDKPMIEKWVEDLVINKTFNGLYVQEVILAALAGKLQKHFRMATPDEESKGIDGFIGDVPYSVKPDSYKIMDRLPEAITVKMIYYTKTKTGLKIEVEE